MCSTLVSPPVLPPPSSVQKPAGLQGNGSTHQDTSDLIQRPIQDFLANGVVTTGIVVGGVLLATDQQLRVEQLSVVTSTDLIDRAGVQVDKDRSGHVFAGAGLGEDGIELTAIMQRLGIGIGTAVLLEAVLEEVPVDLFMIRSGEARGRDQAGHTAPRHCFPAGFRPGRCGGGESAWWSRQLEGLPHTPQLWLSLHPGVFAAGRAVPENPFICGQEGAVFTSPRVMVEEVELRNPSGLWLGVVVVMEVEVDGDAKL